MGFKDNKEFIIIIIGFILTITIYGSLIGLPLILIGAYLLNKKAKNPLQSEIDQVNKELQEKGRLIQQYNEELGINQTLKEKREEIQNIDERLKTLEQERTEEINIKLANKQKELDELDEKYQQLEKVKTEEINQKLASKQNELDELNTKYQQLEEEKTKQLDESISARKQTLKAKEQKLAELNQETRELENRYRITSTLKQREEQLDNLNKIILEKQEELGILNDSIEMQDYGLYEPQYNFTKSEEYKEKLKEVRNAQKQMIKDKRAALCSTEWTIDGSKSKGQALTNQNLKQAIYTFNVECEQIIAKTRPTNIPKQKEKIEKVFNRINKMNERNFIYINKKYLDLKYDELQLAVEYEQKKQEEKELLKEAREREKEERKLQKELDRKEREIAKQKTKLQKELEEKQKQAELEAKNEEEKQALLDQIEALKQQINKQDQDQKDIENRRLRTGAGFIYIISNIGSFGEGVYKIGVTRRDDPEARVNELSNASVPFKYDVHAFIFSENAFDLETQLHQKYDKQRVNKVNNRKEFFKLSDEDIQHIVNNNKNSTYSFTLEAEALEYYESLQIEKQQQKLI